MGSRTGLTALVALLAIGALASGAVDAEAKRGRRRGSKIPAVTKLGLPNVQSATAFVLDSDSGAVLFAKDPDDIRHIASTGKIFVALVVRKHGIDLEKYTEITKVEEEYAKGGARSRLRVGHKFRNIDLLRAMLISSDNRAPVALGRAVGLEPAELVKEMNTLARELGLTRTEFTDPSGLRGNESTAREMVVGLLAAQKDPVIADVMGTTSVVIRSHEEKPIVVSLRNTNRSLRRPDSTVLGGKTGYTEAAGYCLVISAEVAGKTLAMAFLGSNGKLTRFADFGRVTTWLHTQVKSNVASTK